jgi:hypothetical protein
MRYCRGDQPHLCVISAGEALLRRAHQIAQASEQRVRNASGVPGLPPWHTEDREDGSAHDQLANPEGPQGGK